MVKEFFLLQTLTHLDTKSLFLPHQTLSYQKIITYRQWLFCRRRQFTLRDYFAVSYL